MTGVNGGKLVLLLVFGVLQHIDAQAAPASMVCQRRSNGLFTSITVQSSVFTGCTFLNYNDITSTVTPTYNPVGDNCNSIKALNNDRYSRDGFAATTGCAVLTAGLLIQAALHCYVDEPTNGASDRLFTFVCDTNVPGQVINAVVTTNATVGNPPIVSISRQYSVALTAKLNSDINMDSPNPISLGTLIRLVVPFDIKNKAAFDTNGPKGVFLPNCILSQLGVSPITLTDSNGCIIQSNINIPMIPNGSGFGRYLTYYAPNTQVPGFSASQINSDRNAPLNTFLTLPISVRSLRRRYRTNVALTCSCNVGICFTTTDSRCFGSPSTACNPLPAGRKRRDTASFYANSTVAETVQATLVIKTDIDTTSAANTGDCFDKTTFVALTAVLGVLLLIVLVIAVFLFCHLMKTSSRASSHDDRSSASTASGIMNKGFY